MVLVACALPLAALAWLLIHARVEQVQAERCMAQVTALSIGRSTFEEAKRISDKFGGVDGSPAGNACSPKLCDLVIAFRNLALTRLGLARPAGVIIYISISEGVVESVGIRYTSPGHPVYLAGEEVARTGVQKVRVHVWNDINGNPNQVAVRLTTEAPEDLRARVFAIDLSCLGRPGPCSAETPRWGELKDLQ